MSCRYRPCDYYAGPEGCAPRTTCYWWSSYRLTDMTLHPAYGDEDLFPLGEEYSAFCTCSTFYGHMGVNCDVVSGDSATLGIYAALWTVFAIFNFCAFAWTLISFIKQSMAKGRISWNIAAFTLIIGVFASLSIAIFVSFFTITSFIMDPDLTIERYFLSPMTGIMATFTIPCLLNVSTMWLDVALSSMKGGSDSKGCFGTLCACCMPPENMTSATRKKFKAKVQMGVVGLSVTSALIFPALLVVGATTYAAGIMTVLCVGMCITYSYGAKALTKMLDSSPKHGDETEVKGGMCRGCKGGGSSGKEVNVRMVVSTANNMALSCALNVISVVLYVALPSAADQRIIIRPMALVTAFAALTGALYQVLLYIRFGMRKVLGLEFENATSGSTTTTSTTMDN
mmetsp:Transcript_73503/g.209169  ORF Transcript_73503/g.209169 Transcript_73503/m.209169 type:complete len:398 (-) Transcript_73503:176-1369(-)